MKNVVLSNDKQKSMYIRVIFFQLVSIIIGIAIMSIYSFQLNFNTVLFMLLIPIMIIFLFFSEDLMHPFNIFLMSSQFLFVYNIIDLNANKDFFRYGSLDSNFREIAFSMAILIIIIWYLFMYLGYGFAKNHSQKTKTKNIFSINFPTIIAILLISIGIMSYTYLLLTEGGFGGIIDNLSQRVSAYAGKQYLLELVSFTAIGSIFLLKEGYNKTSLLFIIISFLMLISFGGRANAFFTSIFPYLIYYHYTVKKLNIVKLIPLGIVFTVLAIGIKNYRLYQVFIVESSGLFELISELAQGTEGGEILPSLVGSIHQGHIDYQYGSTLINIIYAFIPRSIWLNKPLIDESGIVGKALMGHDFWGLPPGPYGLAFFNFGIIGVLIFGFIIGFIVFKLYDKFVISISNNTIDLIFYVFIIKDIFNLLATSAQINILMYVGIFFIIKVMDMLVSMILNGKIIKPIYLLK